MMFNLRYWLFAAAIRWVRRVICITLLLIAFCVVWVTVAIQGTSQIIGTQDVDVGRHRMACLGAFRRRALATAGLVGLAALAAGCASGSSSSNQSALPEKASIVVGAVPAADTAGLYIAEQRGFFAAEGLSVKIVPIISAELLSAWTASDCSASPTRCSSSACSHTRSTSAR
jgi:hypothetical protein